MHRPSRHLRALVAMAGFGLLGVGCKRSEPPEQAQASSSGQALEHMSQMYQRMAEQYARMGPTMANDADWMTQMHAQMMHLQESMPGMTAMGPGSTGKGMMGGGMMGRGRMGPGMMGGPHMAMMMGIDRWHDQMARLNDDWAVQDDKAGHAELAELHRKTAELHRRAAREIEANRANPSETAAAGLDGASLYAMTCAACHGAQGQGVPGAFPALAGNSLLDGPADPIVHIVRSGLIGPVDVNGQHYNGAMPAFGGRLSNEQLAAILSYVRSAWGNHGDAVTAAQIAGATS